MKLLKSIHIKRLRTRPAQESSTPVNPSKRCRAARGADAGVLARDQFVCLGNSQGLFRRPIV